MSKPQSSVDGAPTPEVLAAVETRFREQLESARAEAGVEALQALKSSFFGPKGELTLLLRGVGKLPPDQRRDAGQNVNKVKKVLETELTELLETREAAAREAELRSSRLDLTLPGRRAAPTGKVHPINRLILEMTDIFQRMGFRVARGPEVELDEYNFEKLNFPDDHPARDMQDTFFVWGKDGKGAPSELPRLLRTHTSPVQIRAMEAQGAPIRIISPGRVYRHDSDATHSPMFHQIEGLWIDEGVSLGHLKGVLQSFISALFGERAIRLRPSFFPFVEPGVEVDVGCVFCEGSGYREVEGKSTACRVCKTTGWLEVLGAGMVHPNVLTACGVDAERYTGFAFGLGVDRLAMLRYQIDDIAHLYRGDVRFLGQL